VDCCHYIFVLIDSGYDQAGRSMSVVSCSDGVNGLTTREYIEPGEWYFQLIDLRLRLDHPGTDPKIPKYWWKRRYCWME
jgi:hypothetical protein